MITRYYVQTYSQFVYNSSHGDQTWAKYHICAINHIPPCAVAEIAIINTDNLHELSGGVRAVDSTIDRRITIVKATDGETCYTTHVQVDSDGDIEYYADRNGYVQYRVLGYWVGCEYKEALTTFGAGASEDKWFDTALPVAVPASAIADVTMTAEHIDTYHKLDILAITESERTARGIGVAVGGGGMCLSRMIGTTGAAPSGKVYFETGVSGTAYLLGYFEKDDAPGQLTHCNLTGVVPSTDGQWQSKTIVGLPSDCVAGFLLAQTSDDNQTIGVRQTGTLDNRVIDLERAPNKGDGPTWASMHVPVVDGYYQAYAGDVSDVPYFIATHYWDDFLQSASGIHVGFLDCIVTGKPEKVFYQETIVPASYASELTVPTGSWNTTNWSSYFEQYLLNEGVVLDILIRNQYATGSLVGGLRENGSSLERSFRIHESANTTNDFEFVSLHVPLDTEGKLGTYSNHSTLMGFNILGYWVGAKYTCLMDTFKAGESSGWTRKALDTYGVPPGKIAEIVIAHSGQSLPCSGGVRAEGSSISRLIDIGSLIHNYGATFEGATYNTMQVRTSNDDAAIEVYTGDDYWMDFIVVGYWDSPPGNYTELNQVITPPTGTSAFNDTSLASTSIPASDATAEMIVASTYPSDYNQLGVRASGSAVSRYQRCGETNPGGGTYAGTCGFRTHVNVINEGIQTYHSRANTGTYFAAIGYWDDYNRLVASASNSAGLFIAGYQIVEASGNLYIDGTQTPHSVCSLFIDGIPNDHDDLVYLFVHGIDECIGDAPCYTSGSGIIPHSQPADLFTHGYDNLALSCDYVTVGHQNVVGSGDLFLNAGGVFSNTLSLVLWSALDTGPNLIRESDAVFYLQDYDGSDATAEWVRGIGWYVSSYFTNTPLIGDCSATGTVGDGTLPAYNSLGKGYASNKYGSSLTGTQVYQQNILGLVVDDEYPYSELKDYSFAGSGSITAAFWMSGCNTPVQDGTGVKAEFGWFYRSQRFASGVGVNGYSSPIHTVGIEIGDGDDLSVITSVRDIPYDKIDSTGLWWGGTTHYGTPTSSSWTWNPDVDAEYHTWIQKWPTLSVNRDDVAFFVIRSEFVPSGNNIPDHMDVYLSVNGQPWTFVGSGITGPPASSVYSTSNPYNLYSERGVGVRLTANNADSGVNAVSVGFSEAALWTDTSKFTNDELQLLYDIVAVYNRPLEEYGPTVTPLPTYVNRTISPFVYPPVQFDSDATPCNITSGLLVTLEVGIGGYGEDASAYLLEEVPPSGFYICDISPAQITYPDQADRPPAAQQIFHDPQSGVIEPYGWANTYNSTIRWISHDNHPEKDQRRSASPTKTYTYKLFPIRYPNIDYTDDFVFSGSGLFFGGSTGSGIFSITTTGDESGTTAGIDGGTSCDEVSLFISGPTSSNNHADLYIRTSEIITTSYIGRSSRTPNIVDFIYKADGLAGLDTFAGIEYGPALYTMGPLPIEGSCPFVTCGPIAAYSILFVAGHDISSSGFPLYVGAHGLAEDSIALYTMAGVFEPPLDLTILGKDLATDAADLYTHGPEQCTDSAPLYCTGMDTCSSGIDLYINSIFYDNWILYLKTEDNLADVSCDLLINGFIGDPGISQNFSSIELYIDASAADYPYSAGGTKNWSLFLKSSDDTPELVGNWPVFLKADTTTGLECNLFVYGHGVGQNPHGRELYSDIDLVCSVNPDDPTRIGFTPYTTSWPCLLRVDQGIDNTISLVISGYAPIEASGASSFFIEGLFGQETCESSLFVCGITDMYGSGLNLYMDASTLTHSTYNNLYVHGY